MTKSRSEFLLPQYRHHHSNTFRASFRIFSCLLIFILGWIAGTFFFFYIFTSYNGDSQSSLIQLKMPVLGGIYYVKPYSEATTLMPKRLPEILCRNCIQNSTNINVSSTLMIFFDWPRSVEGISMHNYLSLETILGTFSSSTIRGNVPIHRAGFYSNSMRNFLSSWHFLQYRKLGYNIAVLPAIDSISGWHRLLLTSDDTFKVYKAQTSQLDLYLNASSSSITQNYGSFWFKAYCLQFKSSRHKETSFSSHKSSCYARKELPPFHLITYLRLVQLYLSGGIFIDLTFLVLPSFLETLKSLKESAYMNSYCTARNTDGKLLVFHPKSYESWQQLRCYTSSLFIFKKKKSPIVACLLKSYENEIFRVCIDSDEHFEGAECIKSAFEVCFKENNLENELSTRHSLFASSFLEVFDENPFHANSSLLESSANWTVLETRRIFWMGHLGFSGSSRVFPYPENSLADAIRKQSSLLTVNSSAMLLSESSSNRMTSSAFFRDKLSLPILSYPIVSNNSFFNIVIKDKPYQVPPNFYITGFPYSQLAVMIDLLVKSQQYLLPSLFYNGYSERNLHKRFLSVPIAKLPFEILGIQIDEFVDYVTPFAMKQDVPNARVAITLQHPIIRLLQGYYRLQRLSLVPMHGFDDWAIDIMSDKSFWLFMRNGSSTDDMIYRYYKTFEGLSSTEKELDEFIYESSYKYSRLLFLQSMPFPVVKLYQSIFSAERVLLVDISEGSDMLDAYRKLSSFYSLSTEGLSELQYKKIKNQVAKHLYEEVDKGVQSLGDSVGISQDVLKKLIQFFRPINQLFESKLTITPLSQVNITHWDFVAESKDWQKFSPGWNSSRSFLWFEKDDFNSESGLLKHLLPSRTSSEDSRFNTTLGMLATF